MTTTQTFTSQVVSILAADGWAPRWAACTNSVKDTYGNAVTIHDRGETVQVEFEYALAGLVETMHLDPAPGAHRVAVVVDALAAAPVG